jgi:adenylate cyclase
MRRALLLDPDNLVMRYNAACCQLVQIGDKDEALKTLEAFFAKVTSTTWIWHAEADPDFEPLRDDARFDAMIAAAKKRLGIEDIIATQAAPSQPSPSTA